jgi:hypothetical protein
VGKGVHDKESQLKYLDNRIKMLSDVVRTIDSETAQSEDIDRVIDMLDDLQFKCKQFRRDWEE